MATQAIRRTRPAAAADFHRLADQGRTNGVLLLTEGATGERFATSATQAGTVYRVTAYSCSCPGFCRHQRCQHHSLLLAELGWLPDVAADDPEPDPPAPPAAWAAPVAVGSGSCCRTSRCPPGGCAPSAARRRRPRCPHGRCPSTSLPPRWPPRPRPIAAGSAWGFPRSHEVSDPGANGSPLVCRGGVR